jgi:hypothetical protein
MVILGSSRLKSCAFTGNGMADSAPLTANAPALPNTRQQRIRNFLTPAWKPAHHGMNRHGLAAAPIVD